MRIIYINDGDRFTIKKCFNAKIFNTRVVTIAINHFRWNFLYVNAKSSCRGISNSWSVLMYVSRNFCMTHTSSDFLEATHINIFRVKVLGELPCVSANYLCSR